VKHSFKESYGVLQKHAQTLREQTEPNIDDLLQIVEESVTAYKNCQSRIDAVEKALEKALGSTQGAQRSQGDSANLSNTITGEPDTDEPF
jgi:exodeoxyribonuclease VII small subunit